MRPTKKSHRRNFNIAGQAHVLTFSCYRRYRFLQAERTCEWLAEAIDTARKKLDFALWAYVFMPEHCHLIVYPRRAVYEIADIRHEIKAPVAIKAVRFLEQNSATWLARITRTRGKKTERMFWQSGGGYDRNIDEPRTLDKEIDYIHVNPVRRGFVDDATKWKWSSAGWFFGKSMSTLVPDPIPPEWIA